MNINLFDKKKYEYDILNKKIKNNIKKILIIDNSISDNINTIKKDILNNEIIIKKRNEKNILFKKDKEKYENSIKKIENKYDINNDINNDLENINKINLDINSIKINVENNQNKISKLSFFKKYIEIIKNNINKNNQNINNVKKIDKNDNINNDINDNIINIKNTNMLLYDINNNEIIKNLEISYNDIKNNKFNENTDSIKNFKIYINKIINTDYNTNNDNIEFLKKSIIDFKNNFNLINNNIIQLNNNHDNVSNEFINNSININTTNIIDLEKFFNNLNITDINNENLIKLNKNINNIYNNYLNIENNINQNENKIKKINFKNDFNNSIILLNKLFSSVDYDTYNKNNINRINNLNFSKFLNYTFYNNKNELLKIKNSIKFEKISTELENKYNNNINNITNLNNLYTLIIDKNNIIKYNDSLKNINEINKKIINNITNINSKLNDYNNKIKKLNEIKNNIHEHINKILEIYSYINNKIYDIKQILIDIDKNHIKKKLTYITRILVIEKIYNARRYVKIFYENFNSGYIDLFFSFNFKLNNPHKFLNFKYAFFRNNEKTSFDKIASYVKIDDTCVHINDNLLIHNNIDITILKIIIEIRYLDALTQKYEYIPTNEEYNNNSEYDNLITIKYHSHY